jgi:2-hydroxychromene-2-carboxylate isomerase
MSVESRADRGVLYFDFVSPWAYLMDVGLRLDPLPIVLERRPVLFAGLLNAFGHKGPAEIERKRQFTYEHCTWIAQQNGMQFRMPAVHPFNPLRYLRLAISLDARPGVVSAIFDALYTQGSDPESPAVWDGVLRDVGKSTGAKAIDSPEIKARLRFNTESAASAGVFGVPTITVGNHLFWGFDSLPMVRAYLNGDPSFDTPAMKAAGTVQLGAQRRKRTADI